MKKTFKSLFNFTFSLINGHNKTKEKLNSIIRERENDISNLIDKNNSEQKLF